MNARTFPRVALAALLALNALLPGAARAAEGEPPPEAAKDLRPYVPVAYGDHHYQDFRYRISVAAGPLRFTASHFEYGNAGLYQVYLEDPAQQKLIGSALLTAASPTAEMMLPAAGEYALWVRPLYEPDESYTDPTLRIAAPGLEMRSTEMPCIALADFADYTVVDSARDLDIGPCSSSAYISRVTVNGQVIWESSSPDGGQHRRLRIDPATVPDGAYLVEVEAAANDAQHRIYTDRTFMIDQADQYQDVPRSHWARQPVELMSHLGILNGRGPGQFAPGEPVLRKEFAKMVALTFGLKADESQPSPFADAPGDWSQPYIDALYQAGLAEGELADGRRYFRPDRNISRAEAVTMIGRALGIDKSRTDELPAIFLDDEEIPAWAFPSIAVLSVARWISGFPDGSFHPAAELQRAQAAKILAHQLGLEPGDVDGGGPRPPGLPSGWTHLSGGPERSSYSPAAGAGSTASRLWESNIKPVVGSYTGNVVLGDRLLFIFGRRGRVYGLLPDRGRILWQTTLAGSGALPGSLAYDPAQNLLIATADGTYTNRVVALNPITGRKVWVSEITGRFNSPAVAGGLVVVSGGGAVGTTLFAFEAGTGKLVWQRTTPGNSAPAVSGNRVFISQTNGQVYAYRLSDGEPLWQRHNGWSGMGPQPVVGHGLVLVTDTSGQLLALNEATGEVVWQTAGTGQAAVDERYVWAPLPGGGLAVRDPAAGALVKQLDVCGSTPAIGQGYAYVACSGKIYSIDRTSFAVQPLAEGTRLAALDGNRLYYLLDDPSPWERLVLAALKVE